MLGPNNCGGFYTEEIRKNDDRVGFRIKTISGKIAILSHINIESNYKISKYVVDIESFENLCLKELKIAIKGDNIKYIIIDEIGPMQLFSETYKKMLLDLLNCNKPIIETVFMNPQEWLDEFKKNIKLIDITFDNIDKLPLEIVELVSKNDNELQRKIIKAKHYTKNKKDLKYLIIR